VSERSHSRLVRNEATYAAAHRILGLPEDLDWSDLRVEFGMEQFGLVHLVIIPTGEQVAELAALAVRSTEEQG
jgi:hypothetical protein